MTERSISTKDIVITVIAAVIIVLITLSVMKPIIVRETSMLPTLEDGDYLIINKLSYLNSDHPNRGDIVVFKAEVSDGNNIENKLLVKRVIGIEGDLIMIQQGKVYLNGELIGEPYLKDYYTEGNVEEYRIPENEVFVMGDNREVSYDSRAEGLGTISEECIIGRVLVRLFPFSKAGAITDEI